MNSSVPLCLCGEIVLRYYTGNKLAKTGRSGGVRSSPWSACSALKMSSRIRARQRQPHMPGPWSDSMRSLPQCSHAPAAVAEDRGATLLGAPWAPGVTILAKRPIRFPRSQLLFRSSMNSCPLPRQDASDRQNVPGGGTLVREDSSSRKRVAAALASVIAESARLPFTATIASRKELMQNRGKHHAKASRLRV